jgi:transcriptional regulator with XRE-family HTH domain
MTELIYPPRHRLEGLVAARLKLHRLERGLGLRQAARLIGCSPGFYCDLEHGQRAPSRQMAERIIRALQLNDADAEALERASVVVLQYVPPSRRGPGWTPRQNPTVSERSDATYFAVPSGHLQPAQAEQPIRHGNGPARTEVDVRIADAARLRNTGSRRLPVGSGRRAAPIPR